MSGKVISKLKAGTIVLYGNPPYKTTCEGCLLKLKEKVGGSFFATSLNRSDCPSSSSCILVNPEFPYYHIITTLSQHKLGAFYE